MAYKPESARTLIIEHLSGLEHNVKEYLIRHGRCGHDEENAALPRVPTTAYRENALPQLFTARQAHAAATRMCIINNTTVSLPKSGPATCPNSKLYTCICTVRHRVCSHIW